MIFLELFFVISILLILLHFFSPRKKPRKQSLTSNVRASEQQQWEQEEEEIQLKRKLPKTRETQIPHQVSQPKLPASHYIRNQPHMSLLNRYF